MTKFKDELRKYPWPRSSAIKAHGKRWLEDDRSEDVWQKISKAAGAQLRADDFIRFVVDTRCRADGLPHILRGHSRNRDGTIAYHGPRIKAALRSKDPSLADILEAAAFDLRLWDEDLDGWLERYPTDAISQRDQNGSRSRRAFCLILFDFFKERCGSWMDGEVTTLLDIAMPRDKVATLDEVRQFRTATGRQDTRPRPTLEG